MGRSVWILRSANKGLAVPLPSGRGSASSHFTNLDSEPRTPVSDEMIQYGQLERRFLFLATHNCRHFRKLFY